MMKEEKECTNCGAEYPAELLIQFGDAMLCRSCLNTETVVCSHCGVRVWNDNNYGDCVIPLCEHCYNEYYTTCTHCGQVIHRDETYYDGDDDDPYCFNCYNRYVTTRIVFTLSKVITQCVFITFPKSEYISIFNGRHT